MWDSATFDRIRQRIGQLEPEMVAMQQQLVERPAISPVSGGEGEQSRADFLRGVLESWGLPVEEFRAPDTRVPCGYRPSLVARLEGRRRHPAFWIMTHMDVVPPGPRELWRHEPFVATVEDGRVFGRGTEDNQQELVASLFAARALLDLNLKPEMDLYLLLVADEETGSGYGANWLLEHHALCGPDDLLVVPDAGDSTGLMLEIAEKSIAWVKFTTRGRQAHASAPHHGTNAHRAGANLLLRIDERLHQKYAAQNQLFSPPFSTIEPTKKLANVPNVNTIPGEDIFYFDCRMLPVYKLDDLLADMRRIAEEVAHEFKVEVKLETEQLLEAAPPTAVDAPVVKLLSAAIRAVYPGEPYVKGIGGGTVAALFRRRGIPAVVWGCNDGTAHNPDEYCVIARMAANALVYAHLAGASADE